MYEVSIGVSWLLFISYIIISYLIGYASMTVFKKCPEVQEDQVLGDSDKISGAAIAFTTISLFLFAACFFAGGRGSFGSVIRSCYKSNDLKFKILSILTILCLVVSVALTAFAEFSGVESINKCALISATTQEEIDEFMSASNMLNRLYGIVIVVLIVCISMIVGYLSMEFLNIDPAQQITQRVEDFATMFGRRAKCRTNNKMKSIKKKMYKY